MISRPIHVAANSIISFFVLWLSSIPLYICTMSFFFFFIHSSFEGLPHCLLIRHSWGISCAIVLLNLWPVYCSMYFPYSYIFPLY